MVRPSNSNYRSSGSLEEQLRDAGRKVLHGTMSLILAASLVPTPPRIAFAEAEPTTSEQSTGEPAQEQGSASTTEAPAREPSAQEEPAQDSSAQGTDQGSQEAGSQTGETPSEEANNSSSQGEGQNTEEPGAVQEQASNSSSGGEQPSSTPAEQPASAPQNNDSGQKEGPKPEENNAQPAATPQEAPQESVAISATAALNIPEGAKSVEEEGTTYCKSGAKVEFTIDGVPEGAELILDEAKVNGSDEDLEKDPSNKKLTLTLSKEGTYKDFALTGVKVKEGDTTKSASDATAGLDTNVTVDDTAPTPTVKIGDTSIDLNNLSSAEPMYLNAKGKLLTVTVDDAIFDDAADKSSVTTNDGESHAFGKQDDAYIATKESLAEGNLKLIITTCDKLGNTKTTVVPDCSIVIDNTAPTGTYTIGSTELASDNTFEGGGVYITLAEGEQSFNAEKSYVEITGTEPAKDTVKIPWSQYGDDSSSYFPIDGAGIYTISVHLEDKAGNPKGETFEKVTVSQTAPKIVTISSNAGEGRSSLKDKTLATSPAEDDSKATIQVKVSKTHFPDSGISLVVDGVVVTGVEWADEEEKFKVASFDVSAEGSHKVNIAGSVTIDESTVSVDTHDVWTVEFDKTAPSINATDNKLAISGQKSEGSGIYKKQENGAPVTVTVEVAEAHFLEGNGDNGGTSIAVTKDGAAVEAGDGTYTLAWDPADHKGSAHTATLTFPNDGTYEVTAAAGKDALGNESDQEATTGAFTIDNTAPEITNANEGKLSVTGTPLEGTTSYKKQESGDPVTVTVKVDEAHFLAGDGENGGTSIAVTDGNGNEVDSSKYTLGWDPADHTGSTHTATLTFPEDGTYEVTATAGKDALGNGPAQVATTGAFTVDNTAPIATLAWEGTAPEQKNLLGDEGAKTAYYDEEVEVVATINDANLDMNATTINSISLAALMDKESVKTGGVTYTHSGKPSSEEGLKIYMAYSEGSHAVPTVHAVDKVELSTDAASLFDPDIIGLVVDKTNPTALVYTKSTPFNKEDMLKDVDKRGYYFFKTDEQGVVEVEIFDVNIDEKCIQVTSPDPYYASYTIESADPPVPGKYVLKFPNLTEANDFTDDIIITVEDFAKRVTTWSMSADGILHSYIPGTGKGIDSKPSVLVEDDTPPVLEFSEFKKGKLDQYPTYVNESREITLTVTERNFNLIHRLDSGRALYTVVSPTGTRNMTVGPDESQTKYTETIEAKSDHSNDGHYKFDASLTDFVGLTGEAHLKEFVMDTTDPVVDVKYDNNDVKHGMYYDKERVATITVTETNFDPDLFQIVVDDPKECEPGTAAPKPTEWKDVGNDKHQCTIAFVEDAHYKFTISGKDLAGNKAVVKPYQDEFVVDKTDPEVDVTYDNNEALHEEYYDEQRVATITVTDRNFDSKKYSNLFTISVDQQECKQGTAAPKPTEWKDVGNDKHQCTIAFVEDARYSFTISGEDLAGNQAVVHSYQDEFVVDKTAPAISTDYESIGGYTTLLGDSRRFYPHAINITTTIKDRYLDTSTVKIWDPDGNKIDYNKASWSVSDRDEDGMVTYTHVMPVDETDGNRLTPRVEATDLAGNNSTLDSIPFVIDKTAPAINQVSVDQQPTSTGVYQDGGDPIQFFNKATRMTFAVSDIHQLRRVWIDDPDGEYTIESDARVIAEGENNAEVIVALQDGTQSVNDTEYQRNIIFYVEDIAGNQRRWTLDRQGTILKDEVVSPVDNESINNENVYPLALVQDVTAPVVELSGVTAGQFYNTPQTVRTTVNEFNFGYLQVFAGSRPITFVTKYEGNYTRTQSSWEIPASQFQGGRPVYTHDQAFESDGHYVVRAQFSDYANNESNVAEIGEFTIDRTAPVITVTWDNYNAENSNHYKASRTATITVVEHNFNPADFQINTTGAIGVWSTNGDTHTITVTYATDGTYTLTVSGKDKAGNVATAYSEPAFVIDTTMPKVTFKGTVQRYGIEKKGELKDAYKGSIADDGTSPEGRQGDAVGSAQTEVLQDHHAYNGEVSPVIVFRDDNASDGTVNYNPQGVSYTITDGGGNDVTKKFQDIESRGGMTETGNGQEFSFGNLGLVTDENGPVVDVNKSLEGEQRYVYDPAMDGIYTIHATMSDLAGNKAENDITFSVNRYGSTYKVEVIDPLTNKTIEAESSVDGYNYHRLVNVPRIKVTEVNVSGSDSEKDHQVRKEYANATKDIAAMSEADANKEAKRKSNALGEEVRPAGYTVEPGSNTKEASDYGWSEYHYTIREGNFGIGSDSENQDRGQGDYRVNVFSLDRATNDIGTDNYLDTEAYAKEGDTKRASSDLSGSDAIDAARRNAQVSFTLDEIGPVLEDVNLPNIFALGLDYKASFYVNDTITDGDTVKIEVDGRELQEGEYIAPNTPDGTGRYEFEIKASHIPFAVRNVKITVTDNYVGASGQERTDEVQNSFLISILLPEIAVIGLIVGGVTAGVLYFRKRKSLEEPETPGSYE